MQARASAFDRLRISCTVVICVRGNFVFDIGPGRGGGHAREQGPLIKGGSL